MKIAEFLKGKVMGRGTGDDVSGPLDDVLDQIIRIEKARDAAAVELENARRHLENEQARSIDGDAGDIDAAVTGVLSEKEKLAGLNELLGRAKNKAMGLLAADTALGRERLAAVEKELAAAQAAIDTRRTRAIAEFAQKHNFRVTWPNKNNAGAVHLPAMTIEGDELQQIAEAVSAPVHVDQDAGRRDRLLAEQQRINVVICSQPPLALESLLAERRRK